jgi:hypothetical protein
MDKPFFYQLRGNLCVFFFKLRQALHQAAFTPGSVVAVDNAFLGSLIQGANGLQGGGAGFFQVTVLDLTLGLSYECARPAPKNAIAQALFLVLSVTFESRFNVWQDTSSEISIRCPANHLKKWFALWVRCLLTLASAGFTHYGWLFYLIVARLSSKLQ